MIMVLIFIGTHEMYDHWARLASSFCSLHFVKNSITFYPLGDEKIDRMVDQMLLSTTRQTFSNRWVGNLAKNMYDEASDAEDDWDWMSEALSAYDTAASIFSEYFSYFFFVLTTGFAFMIFCIFCIGACKTLCTKTSTKCCTICCLCLKLGYIIPRYFLVYFKVIGDDENDKKKYRRVESDPEKVVVTYQPMKSYMETPATSYYVDKED